jgi:hypothetical protein
MSKSKHDRELSRVEAYELPPSDTYLACFGLFIFAGVAAMLYVVVLGA